MNMKKGNINLSVSIIIAGLIIAGAVVYSNGDKKTPSVDDSSPTVPQAAGDASKVNPVTAEDHIFGNPDAPLKVVEYSDFECPFCSRLHLTLKQLVEESNGQVAWVYRQFPLDSLHPVKARLEAVTSECVAEIGGNNAFWQFAEKFFEVTPSNNQTDVDTVLPQIIAEIGLDQAAIDECVESGRHDQNIQDDINNAVEVGGKGTPYSIIIAPNGDTFAVSGAQPLKVFQQITEQLLNQ